MTGPGRPPVGPTIEVRLHPDTIAELDHYAAKNGISRSQLARMLIAAGLDNWRLNNR